MFIYDSIIPSGNLLQKYPMYRLEVVLKSLENKESLIKLPCNINGSDHLLSSSVFSTTFEDFETFGKILSEIQKNLIFPNELIDGNTAEGILHQFIEHSKLQIQIIHQNNIFDDVFVFKCYQKFINGTTNSKFDSTEKSSIILEKFPEGKISENWLSLPSEGVWTITKVFNPYRCKNGKYSLFVEK